MQQYPIWNLRHPDGYDSLEEVLLKNRALNEEDLSDSPSILQDPYLMKDMDEAISRIVQAVRKQERIVVFGDYDADGVTSTAVLLDFLDRVEADAISILPHRFKDGYGMKSLGVERALQMGAQLIITADNGISSFEAVDLANSVGVDVIVIDHHHPQERLPKALALVNPNRKNCTYPFKGLAAVGLVFKVVQALSKELLPDSDQRRYLNSLLDLVSIGTVSDVAPVIRENRLLIRRGLQVLQNTARPGLKALKKVSGVVNRSIDTTTIGFFLAPRINSAGRLASADLALNLIRSKDEAEAEYLAGELNSLNIQRQELQKAGLAEAERQVEEQGSDLHRILVVQGDEWHLGIVGLIASRLTEKYSRPALVCTNYRKNGIYTGSARTISGYNIVEAIFRVSDLLSEYGGHADAAGFSVPAKNYDAFCLRLIENAERDLPEGALTPQLDLDTILSPKDISLETIFLLSKLAPFGVGNLAPRFLAENCEIADIRTVGQGMHLKLILHTGKQVCNAIWWQKGDLVYEVSRGARVDVAFCLETNTWKGNTSVQMRIDDMRPTAN